MKSSLFIGFIFHVGLTFRVCASDIDIKYTPRRIDGVVQCYALIAWSRAEWAPRRFSVEDLSSKLWR